MSNKKKIKFYAEEFVPTFGEEFDNIEIPKFKSKIWTTESVNKLISNVENHGLDLAAEPHPFFDKNPDLRQGRIAFKMTPEERKEFKKCRKDVVYFANKYCKLMTDEGVQSITLYPYQVDMLRMYQSGKNNIVVGSRQIGKTVVAGIFLTWFLLFHADKNIMLGSNKGDSSKEILSKIKSIIAHLPFWLKPGLISFNMFSIMTDASSRILATTTTDKAAIGFTIHLLYLDEFAHVRENIQKPFWDNIYPVMAANENAKLIVTSTPNGYELFQKLYQDAVDGKTQFGHLMVPWWDVPGRDQAWADEEIAILGTDAFNEQFACAFQRSDLLLLKPDQLKKLRLSAVGFVPRQFDILDKYNILYENLLWREDYDIEKLKTDFIVVSVDLAEGIGGDYTTMQIFRIAPKCDTDAVVKETDVFELQKHFYLDQIGVFRDNLISIDDFAKLCYNMFFPNKIFDIDRLKVVLEWNTYGAFFDEKMQTLFGGELYDESAYLMTLHRKGAKVPHIGIKQTKETKPRNCAELKNCVMSLGIDIHDQWTHEEFAHFTKNKKGSYEASTGHDDLVMACVNVVELFRHSIYVDFVAEAYDILSPIQQRQINELMNVANSEDESTDFLSDNYIDDGLANSDWF